MPAIVITLLVLKLICRIRWFESSAMYKLSNESIDMKQGLLNCDVLRLPSFHPTAPEINS